MQSILSFQGVYNCMNNIDNILEGKKHIHFIGIGGSGMCPLAQILHSKGYYLTGSDNNETDTLKLVQSLGIPVTLGQKAENIEGADLIVHTAAIMADNPELIAAKNSGVPVLERSELLGIITKQYSNAVCISGTHGKTTTSSILTQILVDAGVEPSAVIGGKLKKINGYGIVGKSDTMVCEACEFVDTFLKLYPDISVILNIDDDHLDYFKTVDNTIKSFSKFCDKTTKCIIVNGDDENSMKAVANQDKQIITFGLSNTNDYSAQNITHIGGVKKTFDLYHKKDKLITLEISVPGDHNILNALAACVAAITIGVKPEQLIKPVSEFIGAGRRFEILGEVNGFTVADDYAHHPTELTATLNAAKALGFNEVWAVFQPFTYSRTVEHFDAFIESLSIADHVVLSEIMGSREKNTYNIYSKDLADKIEGCVWFNSFEEIRDYVLEHAKPNDLVITLGCGDIYKAAKLMIQ